MSDIRKCVLTVLPTLISLNTGSIIAERVLNGGSISHYIRMYVRTWYVRPYRNMSRSEMLIAVFSLKRGTVAPRRA